MNETVLKYLRELSPETKKRLTKHYATEVEEFSVLLGKMTTTLQQYLARNPGREEASAKQVAFSLMTKGANTLMGGFELALNGYMWEPGILFRSALEGFAAAWDVVHNAERFTQWKSNKGFDSTRSISNLNKAIEPIGRMYGFMSNMIVHTSPLNVSPSMVETEGGPKFQYFGLTQSGKEDIRKDQVYFALLAAYICLQLTELVFHNYSVELETIEKIPGTDLVRTKVSERHQPFIDAAIQHFTSIAEGR